MSSLFSLSYLYLSSYYLHSVYFLLLSLITLERSKYCFHAFQNNHNLSLSLHTCSRRTPHIFFLAKMNVDYNICTETNKNGRTITHILHGILSSVTPDDIVSTHYGAYSIDFGNSSLRPCLYKHVVYRPS